MDRKVEKKSGRRRRKEKIERRQISRPRQQKALYPTTANQKKKANEILDIYQSNPVMTGVFITFSFFPSRSQKNKNSRAPRQ